MIKLLLADDQDILTEGLKLLLGAEEDIEIVGTADNGKKAYELCRIKKPHLVLMDIQMPEVNGVEATAMIKKDL
jgi:YesN/AraC family two-component response regulator